MCDTLKRAYELAGSEISLHERLRLPMYLQLANRNDEGWKDLSDLNILYLDSQSQYIIADKMRIFLQKEKRALSAIPFGIYSFCKEIDFLLEEIEHKKIHLKNLKRDGIVYDKESLIYVDGTWEKNKISTLLDPDFVQITIHKLLKKAKCEKFEFELINEIQIYIMNNYKKNYTYSKIDKICKRIILT